MRRHASCAPGVRACPPCAPPQRRRPQPLPPALSHSVASGSTSRLSSLDGGESRGGRGDDAEGEQREGGRDSGSNCLESDDGRGGGGDSRPAAVAAAVAAVQGRLTPGRPAPAARWGPRTILYLVRHGGRRSCTWPLARNFANENGMSSKGNPGRGEPRIQVLLGRLPRPPLRGARSKRGVGGGRDGAPPDPPLSATHPTAKSTTQGMDRIKR